MRRPIAALAAVLLIGGCASGADPPPPGAPATSTPASGGASAPPTALTPAQAKVRYVEIVTEYNTALERFEDAAQAGKSWKSLRPLAEAVARANAAEAEALRATAWPAEVRAPMTALLKEIDAARRLWQRAARADTEGELTEAVFAAAKHSGAPYAGQIRDHLGLPPYSEG